MRFKSLPPFGQRAIADMWTGYVAQADADLLYPIVSVDTWLKAFRQVNPKIRSDGFVSPADNDLVTDLVDVWLHGPAPAHGTCACCNTKF